MKNFTLTALFIAAIFPAFTHAQTCLGESSIWGDSFEVCLGATVSYSTDLVPDSGYERYWEVSGGSISGSTSGSSVTVQWNAATPEGVVRVYIQTTGTSSRCLEAQRGVSIFYGTSGTVGSINVCEGHTANLTVSSFVGSVIRWEKSNNGGSSWVPISSTSTTLEIGPSYTDYNKFRCITGVSNCSLEYASNVYTASLHHPAHLSPTITYNCSNGGYGTLSIEGGTSSSVTGWDQWNGSSWTQLSTDQTYNYSFTGSATYRVRMTNGACGSSTEQITFNGQTFLSAGTISPATQTVCGNISSASQLSLSGSVGTIEWQYFNPTTSTWTYANSTATTLSSFPGISSSNAQQVIRFRAHLTSSNCGETWTDEATITVNPVPDAAASNQTICSGNTSSVGITTPNGVSGTTYSWTVHSSSNVTGASADSGSTIAQNLSSTNGTSDGTVTYTITPVASSCTGSTTNVTVTVKPTPADYTVAGTGSFCGSSSVTLSGSQSGFSYQLKLNGSNSGSAVSGTGAGLSWNGLTSSGAYTVVATNPSGTCPTTMSNTATLTILTQPSVHSVSGSGTTCATGTVSLDGSQAGASYQLKLNGSNSGSAVSGTGSAMSWTSLTASGTYTIVSTLTSSGCALTMTGSAVLTVNPVPSAYTTEGTGTYCANGTVTLTDSDTGIDYQLKLGGSSIGSAVAGTGSALAWNNLTSSGTYTVVATNSTTSCTQNMTGSAALTVDVVSVGGTVASGGEFYGITSGTLNLSGHTGTIQKWQQKIGTDDWTDIAHTAASLSYTNISTTRQYRAEVKSGSCSVVYAVPATITVFATPAVTITGSTTLPPGGTTLLTATGGMYSYQWLKNDVAISGATTPSLTVTHPASYKLSVKGSATASAYTTGAAVIAYAFEDPLADMNYIQTIAFNKPGISPSTDLYGLAVRDYSLSTTYFDGLGRPVQTVGLGAGREGKDIIQVNVYDEFGREARRYLPYAGSSRDGRYQPEALTQLASFYNTAADVPHDTVPYSKTVFEPSPLNRSVKDFGPGQNWSESEANKYVGHKYLVNIHGTAAGQEKIIAWDIDGSGNPVRLMALNSGYYPTGSLTIKSTTDEQGNEVREYTNKLGKVILKKVYAAGGATDLVTPGNWAETYYIYDAFNRLRFVLQPELSKTLAASTTANPSGADLARLAFQYTYDRRGRKITEQVPGAAAVYMVYDKRDRLVLTQDGNLRAQHQWTFTKYDTLNRPVMTGIYSHGSSKSRAGMDSLVSTVKFCEKADTSATHGYTNSVFPVTNLNVLMITYYDSYSYIQADWGSGFNYVNDALSYGGYSTPSTYWPKVVGQVTGRKVKVLDGGSTYLRAINYYDDRSRVVQTISENLKGGKDRLTTLYDFTGKVIKSASVHVMGATTHTLLTRKAYDHAGRSTYTYHKTNSASEVLLSANAYNSIGQLKTKKLHRAPGGAQDPDPLADVQGNSYGANVVTNQYNNEAAIVASGSILLQNGFIVPNGTSFRARIGKNHDATDAYNLDLPGGFAQDIDYKYNIRGWLTHINQADVGSVVSGNTTVDLFGMELGYQAQLSGLTATTVHNGNISSMQWAVAGNAQQAYLFNYDPMNRLLHATHFDKDSVNLWAKHNGRFSERGLTYDLNGNILGLKRKGYATGTYMDNLTYGYTGNQLLYVNDAGDAVAGFVNANTGTDDYAFDSNGNMSQDKNKGIGAGNIRYNFLNLPRSVRKSGADSLQYVYDATGRKLKQLAYGTAPKTTDYINEFIYENDTLKFFNHEEGRVVMTGTPEYQYHLKDHLGNVRVTFTTKEEVDQATATLEDVNLASEQSAFLRIEKAKRIYASIFDRTNGSGAGYSQRLNGSTNEKYGIAKSLSVMPGDTVRIGVYGKYVDPVTSNWSGALSTLMTQIAASTSGVVFEGGSYATSTSTFPFVGLQDTEGSTGGPKAYLNWLIFDRNYNLIDGGFDRMSETPKEHGQDIAHELLSSPDIIIDKPGYVYIYLSNEETTPLEVFFDDLKVEHAKGPVVQMDDYYPFGLAFNSYQRENTVPNKYKFGGKEEQTELALNTVDWGWRQYDPAIGRWNVIDQWAEKYNTTSPYAFVQNNPILNREIDGRWFDEKNEKKAAKIERKAEKRADKLEAKAAKIEARGGDSGDRRARAAELRQSGQDVRDMRSDATTEFRYAKASDQSNPAGVGNPTTERTGANQVTMFTEKNMGSKLHEGRHGGQEARGELGNNYQNYGVQDEVSAYRAQYSWSGKMNYVPQTDFSNPANLIRLAGGVQAFQQTITNINQITPALVNTLVDSPGLNQQLIYPPQGISIQQWNGN